MEASNWGRRRGGASQPTNRPASQPPTRPRRTRPQKPRPWKTPGRGTAGAERRWELGCSARLARQHGISAVCVVVWLSSSSRAATQLATAAGGSLFPSGFSSKSCSLSSTALLANAFAQLLHIAEASAPGRATHLADDIARGAEGLPPAVDNTLNLQATKGQRQHRRREERSQQEMGCDCLPSFRRPRRTGSQR